MAPQGFYHAPASKGLVGVTFSAAMLAFLLGKQKLELLGLDLSVLSMSFKYLPLRLLSSQLIFASTGELVFGLLLLYNFRQFEMHLGSMKFLQYITLSMTLSVSAQIALLVIPLPFLRSFSYTAPAEGATLASGPYSIIFSLFVQYVATVPKLRRVKILGAEFSEKSLFYLVGAQLLFSRGRNSFLVGACGFLSGLICMSGYLPYDKFTLPSFLVKFGEKYLYPILKSESPEARRTAAVARMGQNLQRINANAAANGNGRGYQVDRLVGGPGAFNLGAVLGPARARAAPATTPPREEQIESLVAMGFTRDDVIRALGRTNNDVNRAAEQLLGG